MRKHHIVSLLLTTCALALLCSCSILPGPSREDGPAAMAPIIIDSDDAGEAVRAEGDWPPGVGGGDWGEGCRFAFQGQGECRFLWRPDLPESGFYRVSVWFGGDPNSDHATNSPFTVHYDGGEETHYLDQTRDSGGWRVLGIYPFESGRAGYVELTNNANGNVVADAVKFERVK